MPQLDFLTFGIQITLIIVFGWVLVHFITKRVLPSYIHFNEIRKLLWLGLGSSVSSFKFYSYLTFLHLINIYTKQVSLTTLILDTSNFCVEFFSGTLLKSFIKIYFTKKNIFIKINFYKNIFFGKINLLSNFGQKNKLNFLILKNSTYSFVQNYLINLFTKKNIFKRIMIKEVRVCYLLNQIIALQNQVNLKVKGKKLSSFFNN